MAINLNTYIRVLVLLKGKQNINLPYIESKQYATSYAPQPLSFLPSPLLLLLLKTAAYSTIPSEGTTSIQCTIPCLEVLKLPN